MRLAFETAEDVSLTQTEMNRVAVELGSLIAAAKLHCPGEVTRQAVTISIDGKYTPEPLLAGFLTIEG